MADPRARSRSGLLILRGESGKILAPSTVAEKIENMVPTEEGTLRSVVGPAPYEVTRAAGGSSPYTYPGDMHGVFHALIRDNERDILLVHSADQILAHQGWTQSWSVLLGPASSSPYREAEIEDDQRPRFPTQFEATPNGVVIVP